MKNNKNTFIIGIGGPVGSGKTALIETLCKKMKILYNIAIITNDIYTKEDQKILTKSGVLDPKRIVGVETGCCPHTAIREDVSMNLIAIANLKSKFKNLDIIFLESGGDNLAATFSPELVNISIYVIDVAGGDKIPRKGGPGIIKSDFLVINKIDLSQHVGASLEIMKKDTINMRKNNDWCFTNLKALKGVKKIVSFIVDKINLKIN